jgi:TPR repeat protein
MGDYKFLRRIKSLKRIFSVASILIVTGCTTAADGNIKSGLKAFNREDYETALNLWLPLAEQGNAVAQHNLGIIYENGKGVAVDYPEAFQWYSKAAESNYAPSQINLGRMYDSGTGVELDRRAARSWYLKAAEQGIAEAQYNLGLKSFKGEGTAQDYDEAERWFRRAASQDLTNAQYMLGHIYREGHGVTKDYKAAARWYTLAAEQGNFRGQAILGAMYLDGQGVTQDYNIALKWLTLAAEQGHADSYFLRGKIYQEWSDYGQAISDLDKALTLNPGHVKALNSLAWIQSTAKNRNFRSGKEAVSNAERAVSLTKRNDAMILETLAAAYAEDGQYEKAEETIREAISKLNTTEKTQFGQEFEKILNFYAQRKKYY